MYSLCTILRNSRSKHSWLFNSQASADPIRSSNLRTPFKNWALQTRFLPEFLQRNQFSSSSRRNSEPSNTHKPYVIIEFEGRKTKFRVPNQSYNFGNLLQDASAYFNVDGSNFDLRDREQIIWPSSGTVVETIQAESHLIVNLVRKRSSMNSSASSSKIQAKTPLSDTKGEFPSPPKRVQRTTDLKELFSSLEELLTGYWFRERMRERGLDSTRTGVAILPYDSLVDEFLTQLLADEQSVEAIMSSTLPRMETERKLVDSFEEFVRHNRPDLFSDHLELPNKQKISSKKESKSKPVLQLTDLRKPHLWYGAARQMKRKIFLHIGPTNSGKTHTALEALKRSASGVYCGPLRLLAHEIYDRMTKSGIKCNLVTGQVVKKDPDATHVSCTIEMADLSVVYDCAVIDEYQLLGDSQRGWAWTRALLGLQAREIHLCGNEACEELVLRLAQHCGDQLEVERYQRLAPLKVVPPVSRVNSLRPGDCLIAFSRKNIYALKGIIEDHRKDFKCSVVYGSLPPETRTAQARLFNHLSEEYPALVASDAVGMGLNL